MTVNSDSLALEGSQQQLAQVLAEVAQRLQAGEAVAVDAYLARHPALAEPLRRLVPAMEALAEFGSSAAAAGAAAPASAAQEPEPLPAALGDYRIVRELGRGGMGVVYEAEQLSLGRRVALKVLPFAGLLDERQLQRFKNEARAAASLNHPNIVPVYSVGCERGVHYYAMQHIDGRTLEEAIQQRRQAEPPSAPSRPGDRLDDTVPLAHLPTARGQADGAYCRQVAAWGAQIAEALDHAHRQGVVHRDIKPSNLIVDREGKVWVTDFGLAQVEADASITLSGDLLGTLRYMSPEQTRARRGIVDHRTDIYSLGATLYELLALQPAVDDGDREEILHQIAFETPRRLRSFSHDIPPDLETIVAHAMAKDPLARYETAQELADDLRRFLASVPIRARRPTLLTTVRLWRGRPERVRDAGAYMIFFGLVLTVWCLWGLGFVTLGVLRPNNVLVFVSYLLTMIGLVYTPLVFLGVKTIQRRLWALWGGMALTTAFLLFMGGDMLWSVTPIHGIFDERTQSRLATNMLIVVLTLVQLGACAIGLSAWYANRSALRAFARGARSQFRPPGNHPSDRWLGEE